MIARRTVMRAGLAIGGGLLLTLHLPGRGRAAQGATAFAPNAFVRIDRSGAVTLIMGNTECGQGIWTSSAMLLAEELEVGLDQVQLEAAPPNAALYSRSAARAAGNRRLHLDPRRLVAAAGGRGGCAHHADRGGGGAMGRGCRNVPRGARHR